MLYVHIGSPFMASRLMEQGHTPEMHPNPYKPDKMWWEFVASPELFKAMRTEYAAIGKPFSPNLERIEQLVNEQEQ